MQIGKMTIIICVMHIRRIVLLVVLSLSTVVVRGQTVTPIDRELGDQRINLSLGVFTPIANYTLSGISHAPNQSIGAGGALQWDFFFHPVFLAGIRLHGWFTLTKTNAGLFAYDIIAHVAYVPRVSRFEFPISVGLGFSGMSFTESVVTYSKLDLAVHSSFGVIWNIDTRWGLGVNVAYLLIPQLYDGPTPPREHSRLANFIGTAIMVTYNF